MENMSQLSRGVNCFTCSLRTCQKVSVMRADAVWAASRGGGRKEKGAMFSLRSNISAVRREAPPGSGLTRIPEGRARHLGLIKLYLDIVHREFISEDAQSSHSAGPPPPDQTPYEKLRVFPFISCLCPASLLPPSQTNVSAMYLFTS